MDKRVHKVHTDKGVFDAYKFYKENVVQKGSYKLTRTQFSQVLKKYYTARLLAVIYENRSLKIGRAGEIKIMKYKHEPKIDKNGKLKYTIIDWKKTKELGKQVLNFNEHSDGYLFKFKWIKKLPFKNKALYRFKVSRDIGRALPKALKKNKNLNFEEYGRR